MNNVITFMLDSVIWDAVGNNRCKISPTPFLDSLKKESVVANKIYSHGPYTNAATRSLYTGRDSLDDFGYFFQLNTAPITDYQLFHECGYETIALAYAFYIIGPELRKHIDTIYYTTGFEFNSEWGGIFNYYYEIFKERDLTPDEWLLLRCRTDLMFKAWIGFYDDIISNPQSSSIIKRQLEGIDLVEDRRVLKEQYTLFKEDELAYLKIFLSEGRNHILLQVNKILIDTCISRDFLNRVYRKYHRFFRSVIRNNCRANIISNFPSPKRVWAAFLRRFQHGDREAFIFLQNYFGGLTTMQLMHKRWGTEKWQDMPCVRTQLKFAADEIIRKRDSNKPFYLSIQVEEAHNNLAFFSYDIQDEERINEELEVLQKYVNELGKDFKGNLLYYLSLRYIDYSVEEFCNTLKEKGLWDNTTLLLTADHGSSYTFYPIHNKRVNCFDEECYHISTIIRHPGFKGAQVDTYQNSKDILPTLAELLGMRQNKYFTGHSMLDDKRPKLPYVISEYMGPGCPDMHSTKRMWLRIQDRHYLVGYKVSVSESFEDGELSAVYDLKKDPQAFYNLNYSIDRDKIQYLLEPLKQRFLAIQEGANHFMAKMRTWDGDYKNLINYTD